jgi:hypothetical protein
MQKRSFTSTVTGQNREGSFLGYKELKEGNNIYGEYLQMFETVNAKTKAKQPNYKIKVLDANFKAPLVKDGKPEDLVGKIVILNSAGSLNHFMKNVQVGMHVDIEYAGKQKGKDPKDDTMYHTFSKLDAGFPNDGKEVAAPAGGRNAL